MLTRGARFQTKTRGSEGRLVRGDETAGGKLEVNEALFACVAMVREKRREQGLDEVKLMFIDVKKAHFHAKCDELNCWGRAASTTFHHPKTHVRVVVHGDEFTLSKIWIDEGKSRREMAHASEEQRERTREDDDFTAPTSHEAGRVRAVKGQNIPQVTVEVTDGT